MAVQRDLRGLTIALALRSFALALVNVFLPLLMLEQGAALWQVCAFYVVYSAAKMAINYPSVILIERWPPWLGLAVALASSAVYLLLLNTYISGAAWAIWCAPAALAGMNAFLWNSQHIHISRALQDTRRGRDMAVINVVIHVATLAAPPIGAALVAFGGRSTLLFAALTVIALAILPARAAHRLPRRPSDEDGPSRPAPFRDLVANFAYNTSILVHFLLWPVYLAVVFGDFTTIGLITAVTEGVGLLLLLVAGRRGDRGATWRVLLEGTIATALAHLARLLAGTPLSITVVGAVSRAAIDYQQIPWVTTYYSHVKQRGSRYVLWMEGAGDLANLLIWLALLVAAILTQHATVFFGIAFVLAAVATIATLLISRQPMPVPQPRPAASVEATPVP
ncbi:MFS transporter [Stackebrandtia nassauensis]|uniref:Major facilitator superfamily MFS_1 n=1 Tax=Stackebrandtia nassauensis (strain DSM 44728 / CIP 108903 / NRRL B-16338 / NBRC 102104 / LLR-40K-21) TaxID=446470 RepID=D3PUF2_STANL|nr:MFS transporter [Stackebrandtia nassauensis]ADD42965.1 hypothetical protein Snas_3297 [Stackebrandtia nassauensis DSM 44728]